MKGKASSTSLPEGAMDFFQVSGTHGTPVQFAPAKPLHFQHRYDGTQVALSERERGTVMIKRSLSIAVLALVFYPGRSDTQAQTLDRKFEVSAVYSTINLQAFESRESGGGLRLTYNINKYLAVEAEGNVFDFRIGDYPTDEWLGAQGHLGAKMGLRKRWFGLFAKIRPGVASFPSLKVHQRFCFPLQHCEDSGRSGNRLAVDAGAVVELYPARRIIVRLDIGDTMIRFKDDVFFKSSSFVTINDGFSHNAQFSGSVGYRF